MNRLLLLFVLVVVMGSGVCAETLCLSFDGEPYAVESKGGWTPSKPMRKSTEDVVVKSGKLATTCYLMRFRSLTESEAIVNLEGERAQAKINPKEDVRKVHWAKSGSAYVWRTPYYALIYFQIDSRWFRCFALFEQTEKADLDAVITFLRGIQKCPP